MLENAPDTEDADLVRRAAGGDDEAFEELMNRHQSRVYHHALRMMGNSQDAEEVLQDTFVQAYRNLAKFEQRSRFSTWIYRIATNEALMRLRKARRKREVSLDDAFGERGVDEIRDFARSALDEVMDAEVSSLLEKALADLPEEYRAVFVMRDVDGLSNAEVAEILDVSVPAVKSRLHRSRLFLRDRLSQLLRDGKSQPREETNP